MDKEIENWLTQHGIDKSKVMDASGMSSKKEYGPVMKADGFVLATGVTPCKAAGHRLRTRHGHCAMCDPTKVRYQERYTEEAFIYVATPSSDVNIAKIGITTNLTAREQTLNVIGGYGGYSGWKIVFSQKVPNAGEIEHKVHTSLRQFSNTSTYQKNGKEQQAQELFNVPVETVVKEVKRYI